MTILLTFALAAACVTGGMTARNLHRAMMEGDTLWVMIFTAVLLHIVASVVIGTAVLMEVIR